MSITVDATFLFDKMANKQFEHPTLGVVSLIKRRGSKSIRISITPDGKVRVTMPTWVPYRSGVMFLQQKHEWVTSQLETRQQILEHGQLIGRVHGLYFESDTNVLGCRVATTETMVRVRYNPELSSSHPDVQAAAVRGSKKALLKQAEAFLPDRLKTLSELTGFQYKSLHIRQLKSRWGSCSSSQHIILNYYLMMLPDELVDYVMIHELCHTKEMNHSPAFWALVAESIPDYRRLRKNIKNFQPSIFQRLA